MQQHIFLKDLPPHGKIRGVYLISAASLQHAKNGPYWNITLNDSSGEVNAKIWAPLSTEFTALCAGNFVDISGNTALFREQVQININALRVLSDADSIELDMNCYVPSSPYSIEEMWQELEELCQKELTHTPWNDFVFYVLNRNDIRLAFMACPAAKNIHHAYRGGLLEHSLSVAKLSMTIAAQYPELDRQVLLAAAIFHDLGKIWEYSYGLVTDYTDAGRLLGHIHLALEYLSPILELCAVESEYVQHFKHLILSHHGTYEFGSPRLPQTPEAMILHYADNIDAKMAQCKQLFANNEQDFVGWSAYQRSLERYIYQPLRFNQMPLSQSENLQEENLPNESLQEENLPNESLQEANLPNESLQDVQTATDINEHTTNEFLHTEQIFTDYNTVNTHENEKENITHKSEPENELPKQMHDVHVDTDNQGTVKPNAPKETFSVASQLGFFQNKPNTD